MRHVVVLARRPRLGQVKTRLAADVGAVAALRFYRAALAALCRRLAGDRRWSAWLAVTPDDAVRDRRGLPRGLGRFPQGAGDLGARMARSMARFGMDPVVIVASDVPAVERRHVAAAFAALGRAEFVFGPSPDGGFWLAGAAHGKSMAPLFDGPRWSTEHALADTLANVPPGARRALLDELADVDDGAGFRAWRSFSGRTPSG